MKEPTILIVDDDPDIRVGLRYYLESRGFHTLVAKDGKEALEAVRADSPKPQVVVLDLRMPNLGGLTFLHELKGEKNPPKIIVVTALSGDTIEQAVELHGVAKLLTKPVTLPVVEKAIQEALGKLAP